MGPPDHPRATPAASCTGLRPVIVQSQTINILRTTSKIQATPLFILTRQLMTYYRQISRSNFRKISVDLWFYLVYNYSILWYVWITNRDVPNAFKGIFVVCHRREQVISEYIYRFYNSAFDTTERSLYTYKTWAFIVNSTKWTKT